MPRPRRRRRQGAQLALEVEVVSDDDDEEEAAGVYFEEEEDEEGSEEEEDEEEEDDEAEAAALNAAVEASLDEAVGGPPAEGRESDGDRGDEDSGEEEEGQDEDEDEEGKGKSEGGGCGGYGFQLDRSASPNCPICLEPWTADGPHRVCCIPCGHVYGKSCLEKWLLRFRKSDGKCPQCNQKFRQKTIINLYAPLVVVPNDDLQKEVCSLRENNDYLMLENSRLREEIKKHKMHAVISEGPVRQKMLCLEKSSSGGSQRRLSAYPDERTNSSPGTMTGSWFNSQNFRPNGARSSNICFQKEFRLQNARVVGIDASSQILIISGKAPGVSSEHVLTKISLLSPDEMDKVQLPSNTGVVRDMCVLSNGLVLLASLGKKLSLLSMASNNCVLKYDLPGHAWSCCGDVQNPYYVYAGLQNGMLLVFDVRQTSTSLYSMDGLSKHPIHTMHSVKHVDNTSKVLTASSAGPCVWDVNSCRQRPFLIPGLGQHGICISLACSSSGYDMVASFRPRVEISNEYQTTQTSVSSSPSVSGSGKLGSHVLIKRTNNVAYESSSVGRGYVSEVRMSKSAIVSINDSTPLFACSDELSRRVCLWNLPHFKVHNYLRPHPQPILDLKYARATGPGFIGCISEDVCQVFTCS